MRLPMYCRLGLGLLLFLFAQPAVAFDFSGWDALLEKYVAPKTIRGVRLNAVDYRKLRSDPEYNKLITDLEGNALSKVNSRQEKLAFWINVYNIMALKMVLNHYPLESIKDAGGRFFGKVWDKSVGTVAGKPRTLNEIEHDILRKMGEPRIHVAIVCASVSCPDLRREAYSAESLDSQLDDQVTTFLANSQKGLRLEAGNNTLYLSSIFKWFEEDFDPKGGVIAFLTPYAPEPTQKQLRSTNLRIKYMDYDWGLNEL